MPNDFGLGLIIPLVKDKSGDVHSVSNYRGITLIPVLSKLCEGVLLQNCEEFLSVDDLQFGFRKGSGCPQALYTLKSTVDYFTNRGSSVYAAALDISTLFERRELLSKQFFKSMLKSIELFALLTSGTKGQYNY